MRTHPDPESGHRLRRRLPCDVRVETRRMASSRAESRWRDRWRMPPSFSKPSQRLQVADRLFKRTRAKADKETLPGLGQLFRAPGMGAPVERLPRQAPRRGIFFREDLLCFAGISAKV